MILNVSYSSHTWRVRTCNTNGAMGCCSPFADDTFVIYNNAPLPPTLVHVNNSHLDSAVFYWTNGSDIDNDSIYHQFQFDSEAIQNNSFSPVSTTGIAFGSHTWRVRACDFLTCSAWAEDTFSRSNNAPSAPALFAITNTTGASVTLNWTPGTDPENDPVYDDFQFSIYYDFSTNIVSLSNTTRPVNVAGLSAFEKYYWRVRTCDGQSCSAWSASSFVKYLCTNATQNCTASCNCNCGGGGGHAGGGGGVTSLPPQKLVQIILPSGTIEVAPPEIVKAGNATNITKEVAEAKPLLELPFSVITSKVTKINWLIIVLIAAIILAILISRKIRENKRRKKRIQELLKGI